MPVAEKIAAAERAASRVERAEAELEAARVELRSALVDAHGAGVTFATLGRAIGLSRQRVAQIVAG